MTEQGGAQGQGEGFSLRRLAGAARRRAGEAWSTRPGGGGSLTEQELPPLLTHERILLEATNQLDGILYDAETEAANLTSESLQRVAKRSLNRLKTAVDTKKKDLGRWQAYCEHELKGIEISKEYHGMLAERNRLAHEVNRYGQIAVDKNVPKDQGLDARVNALKLQEDVENLDGKLKELEGKARGIYINDGEVLAKLEEEREIREGKKRAPKPPANKMARIVYDAEQGLIEHILGGGLKAELEAAVAQERNVPPPLPRRVEAMPAARPVQPVRVTPRGRQPVTPSVVVRQERPAAVPARETVPPTPSRVQTTEPRRGRFLSRVREFLGGGGRKPEAAEQVVQSFMMENPVPYLRQAKEVLARTMAGVDTHEDELWIANSKIFEDVRYKDLLADRLTKARAQGDQYRRGFITRALGKLQYLTGLISAKDIDIEIPEIRVVQSREEVQGAQEAERDGRLSRRGETRPPTETRVRTSTRGEEPQTTGLGEEEEIRRLNDELTRALGNLSGGTANNAELALLRENLDRTIQLGKDKKGNVISKTWRELVASLEENQQARGLLAGRR